ncbi:MAG: type IV toxin-antitoxin system AbiEi family antitoxin domain-containing protein [Dermatophilaceae bacterium]
MDDVTAALAALPEVFTTQTAMAAGISHHILRRLVRHGSIIRFQSGVYGQPHADEPEAERWARIHREHTVRARAALQAHPDHALSHRSGALVFGWPVSLHPDEPVHLTALHVEPRSRRVDGKVLHHSDSIINDVVEVDGLRLLAPDRTVADCLRTMTPANGVAVADGALRERATDLLSVESSLAGMRHWRGRPKANAALRLVDPRRETWLESFSFVALHGLGIDLPTPQVEVFDEWGRLVGRVDGMWIAEGTVAEADGQGKYLLGTPDGGGASGKDAARRVVAEKCREDDLRDLGLEMVRWGVGEIRRSPEIVARRVDAARVRGDIRRFRGRLRVDGQWLIPSEHR